MNELDKFKSYLFTKNLAIKTIEAYSKDIKLFSAFIAPKTLFNCNEIDVKNYLNNNKIAPKTYNRKITSLKQFYLFLNKNKINFNLNINQLESIKNEKIYPKIISLNDIKRMIYSCGNTTIGIRNKTIISMLYLTGLRVSELVNLTYSDINFTEGYIRSIGKGNKEKIINVGDLLKITLDNYTKVTRNEILNGLKSDYVFVNIEGEPLTRQTIYNVIKESALKTNILINVTPHTLRHCFATHMLENGADLRSVQEMLGHSDVATTQIYLNIANSKIKDDYFKQYEDYISIINKENLKKESKNMKFKRAFVIVCDSMGIGEGKDAAKYNDEGSNTFKHIDDAMHLDINELASLGIDSICNINKRNIKLDHAYALRMNEASIGKDTLTGHYELMGLKVDVPFKTFTDTGFPKELIKELEKRWGRKIIGNCSASGTEIIKELGEEHMKTGNVIVYTSSDSVLQVAAHEDIISVDELYNMCEIAREITKDEKYKLGRIIARPFIGTCANDFKRTPRRHDYALKPFSKTELNILYDHHFDVISIGKIVDIFVNEGITDYTKIINNDDGCEKIIARMKQDFTGLCFANLVDFDMEYGHRRNVIGYGKAIEAFDKYLTKFKELLNEDDILFITADHGNDPTWKGTDHTREKVPLLIYSKAFKGTGILDDTDTFATLSATLAEIFNVENTGLGTSILNKLK